jgi:glycosyltransferase involved in cell wall biosynthesis
MKALRFPKMMKGFFQGGVIEYGNEGSESLADEHVKILTKSEVRKLYPRDPADFIGNHAKVGSEGHRLFEERLRRAMRKRVRLHDFVAHPFGCAHASIIPEFAAAMHVETGIGYPDAPIEGPTQAGTTARIYESHAWMYRHLGRWEGTSYGLGTNPCYSFVIPNYFDPEEWPYGKGEGDAKGPYILFMGRINSSKGADIVGTLLKAWFQKYPKSALRFVFAGQGDFEWIRAHCGEYAGKAEYVGALVGKDRSKWMRNAVASIMPTQFIEPFGGSGVEGLLSGTPLLASDWGAFTETIEPGLNGYRFRTLGDMIRSVELVLEGRLNREDIAAAAREKYSLAACRKKYERVFTLLHELKSGEGAMSTRGDTLDEGS